MVRFVLITKNLEDQRFVLLRSLKILVKAVLFRLRTISRTEGLFCFLFDINDITRIVCRLGVQLAVGRRAEEAGWWMMDVLARINLSLNRVATYSSSQPPSYVFQQKDAGAVFFFLSLAIIVILLPLTPWIKQICLVVSAGKIGCDGCTSPDKLELTK